MCPVKCSRRVTVDTNWMNPITVTAASTRAFHASILTDGAVHTTESSALVQPPITAFSVRGLSLLLIRSVEPEWGVYALSIIYSELSVCLSRDAGLNSYEWNKRRSSEWSSEQMLWNTSHACGLQIPWVNAMAAFPVNVFMGLSPPGVEKLKSPFIRNIYTTPIN